MDFGPGEPDFPTPANIKQAAIRAIEQNFTRYTSSAGTPELRQAIVERHAADFGTGYTPAECVVAVGGKQAIFDVMQVLVDPRRRGGHPRPLLGHLQGRGELRRRQVRVRSAR